MPAARAKFDQMWRIWYAILVLLLHCFLLYSAFQRYAAFRAKALRESWDMSPMNFYLAAMLTACFLLPLFLFAAFARTGNYAEDSVQVGRDKENLRVAVAEAAQSGAGACVGRMRRHCMPFTCVLHLLMSVALLAPLPVLEAHEILKEKLPTEEIWRTNLDFLLRPSASARNSISTEVFNLVLALAILLVRYPSVFWFSNRVFAFLFSVILCACSLHLLLAYEATSVLFKAAMNQDVEQVVKVNLAPAAVLPLHVVGDLLLLFANLAFFEFGYAQMLNSLRKYRHYLQLEDASGSSDRSASTYSDDSPCWLQYAPMLIGILLMVLAVAFKAPVLWDWVGLFRSRSEPIMLAAVLSAAVYLALWVGVWFLFGFKANWRFNIRLEVEIPNKLSPGFPDSQSVAHEPEHRATPSTDSDLGKRPSHYVYVPRDGVSMIPTISEQVDNNSENSYSCGGTMERQSGLVKYQVRRNSAQSISQMSASGSLRRNSQQRKSGNRVTFKDLHETIPGSPGSSQNASSDSGIEAARPHVQINPNDDYARVNKPGRAPSRQSNYEDYQMFGNLFQEPDRAYYTRQELEMSQPTYASQSEIYGRPPPQPPVSLPPPQPIGRHLSEEPLAQFPGYAEPEYLGRVPDILLSRSPYGSLSRQAAKPQHQQQQQQHQQQQQQQLMSGSGDFAELQHKQYSSLPPPPHDQLPDHVDGLCSQV